MFCEELFCMVVAIHGERIQFMYMFPVFLFLSLNFRKGRCSRMKQKVTGTMILQKVYRIHTKTGNCYVLENERFYLAVQILEHGKMIWKKYREIPQMGITKALLRQITTCYDKDGNKIIERKKGSTKLTIVPVKKMNKKRSQLVSAS